MRFRRIQEIVLLGFAAIGLAVLALAGAAGPLISFLVPVAFLAALLVPRAWMEARRWQRGWTIAAVCVAGSSIASFVAGAPLIPVTARVAVYLQVHKLFNRATSRDQEQIAFLALGHVALATILFSGLKYAFLLLFFVALAPLLLTLLHLRREIEQKYAGTLDGGRDDQTLARVLRTRRVATPGFLAALLASSLPLLGLTALFFVALPRLGFGLLAGRVGGNFLVGFSSRMELGDLVPLADDPTPILRVEFPEGTPSSARLAGLLFRGTTFDTYDGRAWRQATSPAGRLPVEEPPVYGLAVPGAADTGRFTVRVTQEPFEPRLLFLPAGTLAFQFRGAKPRRPRLDPSPLEWAADGTVSYRQAGEDGIRFEALVGEWPDGPHAPEAGAGDPADPAGDPYRTLPPDSPRLPDLARRLTDGLDNPRAKADAIRDWLRSSFRYTRSQRAAAGDRPLEDFLFRWKGGHCEYFSSAMTLLARAAGLRARNVTGFLGGHWNAVGNYLVVRQSDAHSWAEVEIPGAGWVVYDATPPGETAAVSRTGGFFGWLSDTLDALRTAWNRHVIAFDLPRQIGIRDALGAGLRRAKDVVVGLARDRRELLIGAGAVAVLLAGALYVRRAWRRRFRPLRLAGPEGSAVDGRVAAEARRLLADLERILRAEGIERAVHEPVERLSERAGRHGAALADATRVAVHRYAAARFGGHPLRPPDRRALVQDVSRAVRGM